MERWTTPDDDELDIHRLPAAPDSGRETPRLLLLHGLEGTIRSHYLQGTLALAQARGWAADVLVFRGCNGEVNRVRRMYHSGETTDIDFVVRRLLSENPDQPLLIAGFSLGGNVLLKWLGEQGADAPGQLRAAAAVSVPFDLERGARNIEHGFSRVYTRHFMRSLRVKALAKLDRFPGLFDPAALERARTLFEFDDAVTAPVHGFESAHDYYSRSSSLQYLSSIRVPTLLLSSSDDPFLPPQVLDAVAIVARENPSLLPELLSKGGHVGFVSGMSPLDTHYYHEERVIEFLGLQADRVSAVPTR
jgi:hypothetical protein